jgi:hypothetical protein
MLHRDLSCLTTRLCKSSVSINSLIKMWKVDISGLEKDLRDNINLQFAIYLFNLNNTPITPAMNTKNDYFNANYTGTLYWIYK